MNLRKTWNKFRDTLRIPAAFPFGKTSGGLTRYIQTDFCSCGAVAALTILKSHGINANIQNICEEVVEDLEGSYAESIEDLFEDYGFTTKWKKTTLKNIKKEIDKGCPPICIRFDVPGFSGGHYSVISQYSGKFIELADPSIRARTCLHKEELDDALFDRLLCLHL